MSLFFFLGRPFRYKFDVMDDDLLDALFVRFKTISKARKLVQDAVPQVVGEIPEVIFFLAQLWQGDTAHPARTVRARGSANF